MRLNQSLDALREEIKQCVRCGACQAHCPVYQETWREGSVARGKIALAAALLKGETALDDRVIEDIAHCLLCGACVDKCPNRVPTDAIIAAVRRQITDDRGLSPLGRGIAAIVGSKPLLRGLVKGADLLSPLLFRKIPRTSGLHLRFAPASLKGRTLPPLPASTLFARLPSFHQGEAGKPTVALFAGCAITYLYPEVGVALFDLLRTLGCTLILPPGQGCCGMPALTSGNGRLQAELAASNARAFAAASIDHIVTACASCGSGLAATDDTGAFAAKTMDIHVLLDRLGFADRLASLPRWPQRLRVTYHDPCHLRTRGITREPRALLRALPNADFIEMEDAALCCGLGGTFAVAQPELSRSIADRKVDGLRACNANLIASGCPGCVLQLQDTIDRAGLPVRAVHTLDLFRAALAGPAPR